MLLFSRSVVSSFLRPHGLQHARLPCPSLSPGVRHTQTQSVQLMMPSNHLILCHPLLLPPSIYPSISESESGSVVSDSLQPHGLYSHEILQARILEWVAVPFSRGSSQPTDGTQVLCISGIFFTR